MRKKSYQVRFEVVGLLNAVLADTFVLYTKALNFHWNVQGVNFGPLHDLFKQDYETLLSQIDLIAERIRQYEGTPFSTLREFLDNSDLQENPNHGLTEQQMLMELHLDHEHMIEKTLEAIELLDDFDVESAEHLLLDFVKDHEKMSWMLKSSLPKDYAKKS